MNLKSKTILWVCLALFISSCSVDDGTAPGDIDGCSLSVTSGQVLWLRADSITGVANNGAVSSWPDRSGNGRDFSQSDTNNQPLFVESSFNDKPVVRFEGDDGGEPDCLTSATNGEVSSALDGVSGWTMFLAVDNVLPLSGNNVRAYFFSSLISGGLIGVAAAVLTGASTAGRFEALSRSQDFESLSLADSIATMSGSGGAIEVIKADFSGDTLSFTGTVAGAGTPSYGSTTYVHGTPSLADTIGSIACTANDRALIGDIGEIIIYNSVLSTSDTESVESYLSCRYGLEI